MVRYAIVICGLTVSLLAATGQVPTNNDGNSVEVVATASEYVPRSTTISQPGHSYTDCSGDTSYFGSFSSFGSSGTISGSASTRTSCSSTFSPPTETTLTTYRRVNYTIVKGENALYLLSCTQTWEPTPKEQVLLGIMRVLEAGSGSTSGEADRAAANAKGQWSECPAFSIRGRYILTVHNTSDARLDDTHGSKPIKLEYLSSAALPPVESPDQASEPRQRTLGTPTGKVKVHVTSLPSGAEIYLDGKFFGNTPSDISVAIGEHVVKVTIGDKQWSRSVEVTSGEISLYSDFLNSVAGDIAKIPAADAGANAEPEHSTNKTMAPALVRETVDAGTSESLGTISITSNPTGAEIYVDDSFVGKTPATVNLKPGRHSVRAFAKNYQNWSEWITVGANSQVNLAATMVKSN
jgi:hypothetical protein